MYRDVSVFFRDFVLLQSWVKERAGANVASRSCARTSASCVSVAEFDERLWGAMVDYVTVGVDKRLTVMFRNGTGI